MNLSAYFEKCFTLLNTSQFNKLTKDPTHATERKIQRVVRKIKLKLPSNIYLEIYPTGSAPGKFYRTAEIHKLSPNDTINESPLYLAELFSPLSDQSMPSKAQSILLKKSRKNTYLVIIYYFHLM